MLGFETIDQDSLCFLRTFRNQLSRHDMIDHTHHTPWNIIKRNLDIPWEPMHIRFEKGDITGSDDETALSYFSGRLNFSDISEIADIDFIINTKDKFPWVWDIVSCRSDITYEDVMECPDKFNLNIAPLEDHLSMSKRWLACHKIQRYWKRCVSSPEYQVCRRRLEYEFKILSIINA
jgi:hypothetical protein